ncbi:hypothetical protein R0J87_21395, partial [Halomonas sp. SIMBA_159]
KRVQEVEENLSVASNSMITRNVMILENDELVLLSKYLGQVIEKDEQELHERIHSLREEF